MANEKILVIDDEFHIRDSIRLLLEKEGYRVEPTVPAGAAGFILCWRRSEKAGGKDEVFLCHCEERSDEAMTT